MGYEMSQIPYFPGDFQILNTTVLNTIQIGDNIASPIDVLNIYSTTTIGSTSFGRSLSVYPAATGKVLIDSDTLTTTQTAGLLDIDCTSATSDGVSAVHITHTVHNLGNGEWGYALYIDPVLTAAATATSAGSVISAWT